MKWTKVTEKLPPENIPIIALNNKNKIGVCVYWSKYFILHRDGNEYCCLKKVTHWMHFPKPPKK